MNQTIYFRRDVWERFKDEPRKSEMINELIESYYLKPDIKLGKVEIVENIKVGPDKTISVKDPIKPFLDKIVDFKPCKHGVNPKFCKFARPGKPCK